MPKNKKVCNQNALYPIFPYSFKFSIPAYNSRALMLSHTRATSSDFQEPH